jgi:ComF family protein
MLLVLSNTLVRVLLAPACPACGVTLAQPLNEPVCNLCWATVVPLRPPWCVRCGDATADGLEPREPGALCSRCREGPRYFEEARSAGLHEGSLRELIHAFKYRRRRALAEPLARLLLRVGGDVLSDADAVVPVPLHPWRAFERGFNQADDLARGLGLPVWRVLRRHRHGVPQAQLPADRRLANVEGAFRPRAHMGWRPGGHDLRGRSLVLIDDVMTTGATLDACSAALLEAGARTVRALTVARAVARPRPRRQPILLP